MIVLTDGMTAGSNYTQMAGQMQPAGHYHDQRGHR